MRKAGEKRGGVGGDKTREELAGGSGEGGEGWGGKEVEREGE